MARYANFREFYPYYLSEHANAMCRRMHFIGTSLVLIVFAAAVVTRDARWLWLALAWGGNAAFTCATIVHFAVGYHAGLHLTPAVAGWAA